MKNLLDSIEENTFRSQVLFSSKFKLIPIDPGNFQFVVHYGGEALGSFGLNAITHDHETSRAKMTFRAYLSLPPAATDDGQVTFRRYRERRYEVSYKFDENDEHPGMNEEKEEMAEQVIDTILAWMEDEWWMGFSHEIMQEWLLSHEANLDSMKEYAVWLKNHSDEAIDSLSEISLSTTEEAEFLGEHLLRQVDCIESFSHDTDEDPF